MPIARNSRRNLVFRILTAVSDSLVLLVTARGLGVDGRGLYAIASLTGSIVVATLGGTSAALGGEFAHKREPLGRLHAASLAVAIGGGLAVSAAVAVAAAAAWGTWSYASVLLFAAAAAPFLLLGQFQIGLFLAQDDIKKMQYEFLAMSAVPLVALGVSCLVAPGHVYVALAAWAAAQAVAPLVALRSQRATARFSWTGLRPLLRRLTRRAVPISLANGVQLLNYRIDLLVVAAMLPLSEVGRYSVAIAIGEAALIPSRALGAAAYGSIVNADDRRSASLSARTFRHAIILLVTTSIVILVGSRLFLTPILGGAFTGILLPLAILLPGVIALGAGEELRPFLLVRLESSREYLTAATSATVVNLVLAVALVPSMGLAGAALSTSASYLAGTLYLAIRFSRLAPATRILDFVPKRIDVHDYRRLAGR